MKFLVALSICFWFFTSVQSQTVQSDLFEEKFMQGLQNDLQRTQELSGKIEHNAQGEWLIYKPASFSGKTVQPVSEEWVEEGMAAVKTVIGYVAVQNRNCHLFRIVKEGSNWHVLLYTCN